MWAGVWCRARTKRGARHGFPASRHLSAKSAATRPLAPRQEEVSTNTRPMRTGVPAERRDPPMVLREDELRTSRRLRRLRIVGSRKWDAICSRSSRRGVVADLIAFLEGRSERAELR